MYFENFKLLLLICCLALPLNQVQSLRLCGSDLPDALDRICQYGYNPKMKRTGLSEDNSLNAVDGNFGAYSDLQFGQQPLLRALLGESANHLMKTRRRRLGITEECCYNSCTWADLSMYCYNPKDD